MITLIFAVAWWFPQFAIVLADCANPTLTGLALQCCLVGETFGFIADNSLTTCCQFPISTNQVDCNSNNDGLKKIFVTLDFSVNGASVSLFDMSNFPTLEELTVISSATSALTGNPPSLDQIPSSLTKLDLPLNRLRGNIAGTAPLPKLPNLVYLDLNSQINQALSIDPAVTADQFPNLVHIALFHPGMKIGGEIPSLDVLTKLTYLDLKDNWLGGKIPTLSKLTSLKHLDLSSNGYWSGRVPSLIGLSNLEYLNLRGVVLKGFRPSIDCSGKAGKQLQCCILETYLKVPTGSGCCGLGSTSSIIKCSPDDSGVQSIEIYLNETLFPSDWSDFLQLEVLVIRGLEDDRRPEYSKLVGTVPSLPPALQKLDLALNSLSGDLPKFDNLQHVDLHNTMFSGSISGLQGQIYPKLEYLDLSDISLSTRQWSVKFTQSTSADQFPNIVHLALGSVSSDPKFLIPFFSRPNLKHLSYSESPISGNLPSLDALTSLTHLELPLSKSVTGPIPSLAKLTKLKYISLYDNSAMSGAFPSLEGLVDLEYLSFEGCGLTGDLPSLSNLPKLNHFRVDDNWLTGPIDEIGKLTALSQLEIEYNSFTGPIMPLVGLGHLVDLAIGHNLLTSDSEAEKKFLEDNGSTDAENCFPCAKNCLTNIQGWNQFSPPSGLLVPGNYKAVCDGWNQLEWNSFLGCTGCAADDQMEAEAFVTVLANTCQEYTGKPVQPVTFQSSQPANHRGQDYVAQTIAYVDNLVTLTVMENGQTHVCFRDCIPLIPNYNAMVAATTATSAIQEFTTMCTGPFDMKPYLDCMIPIAVDNLESYTDGGRAYEFIGVLKTVCPPYCTSTRLDDCFCGSSAPYKYIETGSKCSGSSPISACATSQPAGYHCYNSVAPPIPICDMQFCSIPENCYCSGESKCVGTPSHPNGKCVVPPKAVAVVQGTKFYAGEDIAIDVNSNAWDLNLQTMTVVSISLSDGTATVLLDKDTCWGTQLNRNAADSKKRYSFKLPSTAVVAGVKSFADLRPAASGQRCSGPESIGLGLGIALPNPATVYTGTATVRYSALSKRRAADAFSEGQVVFSFSLEAKATATTATSTSTKATTSTTTVSTTTSTTPFATSNTSTTSNISTTSNTLNGKRRLNYKHPCFRKDENLVVCNHPYFFCFSYYNHHCNHNKGDDNNDSKGTRLYYQRRVQWRSRPTKRRRLYHQRRNQWKQRWGQWRSWSRKLDCDWRRHGGASQGGSIVIGGGGGASSGASSGGENGTGSSVVIEGSGQVPTVNTVGGGGNHDVGGNASGSETSGSASGVAPSSATAATSSGNSGSRPVSTQVNQGVKPVPVSVETSTRKFLIGSSAMMNKVLGSFVFVSSLAVLF
ncbi:hypothetical protein BDR26DRAFT_865440 [Obelidium mucronatum]|nr:hypothetical protein BDR26DRAFT_865440 [Obelidium mucronatum]